MCLRSLRLIWRPGFKDKIVAGRYECKIIQLLLYGTGSKNFHLFGLSVILKFCINSQSKVTIVEILKEF